MSASVNKAILIGRLGKDPETFNTQAGQAIVKFSLATSETWRSKDGERKERTEWHNIVVYNEQLGKIVTQYVKKGDPVYLEGKISTRKYEKDGEDRYITEIILDQFDGKLKMLASKKDKEQDDDTPPSQQRRPAPQARKPAPAYERDLDDEVPF